MNPDLALLITILILVFAGIFFGVAGLYIARYFAQKKEIMRGGEFEQVTLRILVPKFRREEDVKSELTIQKIQEDISITETFFGALGGLKAQKGFKAWFFGRTDVFSLELVAHEKLITFYITVPRFHKEFLEQQLQAQYSDAVVEEVEDFNMFTPTGTILGGYLKLKREHALPIKTYKELESDPMNAITNALSKVPENEGAAIQFVIRSARAGWRDAGLGIVKNMQKGMSYNDAKRGSSDPWWKGWMKTKEAQEKDEQKRRDRKMSQAEEKMMQGIETKASKAGLDVNVRILVSGTTAASAQADLNEISQAFSQYNIYEYGNAFESKIPSKKLRLVNDFIYRTFDEDYRMVLNTEELSSLWHLPLVSTETPNIRWLAARIAPPPTNIPAEGLHLGYNEYRGTRTEIYMNDKDRMRHLYVIGKTGSGKSWLLRYLATQDIKAGKGVAVIDPHGDLVDMIMGSIPKERIDDVIYFNPSDLQRPMGLNMLEAADESMKDFVVQEMISIFYMLFPPEMIGPMFEHSMRNYMLTLMSDPEEVGTIVEIPRMISDEVFQKRWVDKVKDPVVRSFWEDEMAKTSDYHKSEMMGYLVSKVGRFVENEMMRNIIGQSKSAFDFRKVMDEGKILLVNLSKGQTGEVNASLLGLIIVSKLQMAAFGRANVPEDQRREFFLYIDEFQNYVTPSIATILSEARKYQLGLTLAHQYMGQLVKDGKTEVRDAVLGNVGSYLVARVGPEDTEILGKVFEPTFSAYDLQNTENLTWNVKLIINNSQEKPFTMKAGTPDKPNEKLANALKEVSRLTYGRPKDMVEREIAMRAGIGIGSGYKKTPPPVPLSK